MNFQSKSELAYSWMRDAIIDGTLEAGRRLVIDDLVARIGVSQIPIREALSHLQAEGFVTFQPHVGATVTGIHPFLANEIFGLLETAEVICGREACQHVTPEFLEKLESILYKIDGLLEDPDQFSELNKQFHQIICKQAGTVLLQNVVTRVWLHWDRLRHHYLTSVFAQQTHIAQKEHWELLAALKERDPDWVEEVSRRHNRRAQKAYGNFMANPVDPVAEDARII
jgi:DNA-binding GntR family transcriptional regulator